jgi:hypothetical protein
MNPCIPVVHFNTFVDQDVEDPVQQLQDMKLGICFHVAFFVVSAIASTVNKKM